MKFTEIAVTIKQTWPDWKQRAADIAWLRQEISKMWPDYKERAKQIETLGGKS